MGTVIIPLICDRLIGTLGWREAYLGLAGVIILLALLPVLAFVREPTRANAGLPSAICRQGLCFPVFQ